MPQIKNSFSCQLKSKIEISSIPRLCEKQFCNNPFASPRIVNYFFGCDTCIQNFPFKKSAIANVLLKGSIHQWKMKSAHLSVLHQLLLLTFKFLFVNYSRALHVATHSRRMHLHRNFASTRHTIESASQSPPRAFVMRARNLQVIQEFHLSAGQVPRVPIAPLE